MENNAQNTGINVDIRLKGTKPKINADLYKGCKVSLMFNNVTQCH